MLPHNHCRNSDALVSQRVSGRSNVLGPTDNLPDLWPEALLLQAMIIRRQSGSLAEAIRERTWQGWWMLEFKH